MSGLRVLLIDDEEELVATLAERLELRDFLVDYALNGLAGMARVKEKDYDVIVVDLMMPGMNGHEVLEQVKRLRPDLPVILLTGRGSEQDSESGLGQGAFDYLMKPVNIDRLIEIMRKAVKSHG